MSNEKKSSGKSTTKKTAAKKSPAKSATVKTKDVAEKTKSVAEEIATKPPVESPHLKAAPLRTTAPSPAQLYDEIRRRAYEFYNERGGQHGSHEADWHRAESEVRSKYR